MKALLHHEMQLTNEDNSVETTMSFTREINLDFLPPPGFMLFSYSILGDEIVELEVDTSYFDMDNSLLNIQTFSLVYSQESVEQFHQMIEGFIRDGWEVDEDEETQG